MFRAIPDVDSVLQAASQNGQFSGRVVSASGAMVPGGPAINPGHPVAGATVHLVPVTAMDVTTRMTASAIYAPPFPAEAYDEPLEDAIRLRGAAFPKATTDARGNFVIPNVPDGKFFVHVTPATADAEHLPGGDQSRQSHPAQELRGHIDADQALEHVPRQQPAIPAARPASPVTRTRSTGARPHTSSDGPCRDAPGRMQDFSRHPEYVEATRIVSLGCRLHARNAP